MMSSRPLARQTSDSITPQSLGHRCNASARRRALVFSVVTLVALLDGSRTASRRVFADPPERSALAKQDLADHELQFELYLATPDPLKDGSQLPVLLSRQKELEGEVLGERLDRSTKELVAEASSVSRSPRL